ncbi:MAG: undecaprenyldiphospho-muramoylpentapeptide beta-N-acetylglucosaminyltransferase [Gammaproteobacteria bacterium]
MRPVLISAGGTGGHVFPALAVADELRRAGAPILWLGTRHGIESRVVPAHGYELITMPGAGLRGAGARRWLFAPWRLGVAIACSLKVLARRRPGAVLGMGGYTAGPAGVAAWLMRVPLVVHEQNAIAGMTNRLLAPLARLVLQAFPGTFPARPDARTTGNPVRASLFDVPAPGAGEGEPLRVFVFGGSQGASFFNECMPQVFAAAGASGYRIRHQCGAGAGDATRACYAQAGIEAHIEEFIDDMAGAYAWADVVVCRGGALSVCELAAAGRPAVIVPFPHAVDDHQSANARLLADAGAAVLVQQAQANVETLARVMEEFRNGRPRLRDMAARARALARPQAARDVAGACLEVARG